MDTLRIRSCNCMSLNTAGVIAGVFELMLAVVSMILIPVLVISVIVLIANIVWLYGIYVKNHRLLVPSICVVTILCLWSLVLPLFSLMFMELDHFFYGYREPHYMVWVLSIGSWCVVALAAFIWIVKYSVYKRMVESTHGNHIDSVS